MFVWDRRKVCVFPFITSLRLICYPGMWAPGSLEGSSRGLVDCAPVVKSEPHVPPKVNGNVDVIEWRLTKYYTLAFLFLGSLEMNKRTNTRSATGPNLDRVLVYLRRFSATRRCWCCCGSCWRRTRSSCSTFSRTVTSMRCVLFTSLSILVDGFLFAGRRPTPFLPGSPVSVFSRTRYLMVSSAYGATPCDDPLSNTKTKTPV